MSKNTILTSATLVATTIFHPDVGANTERCSSLERFACNGSTFALATVRKLSTLCRISCTPGKNIKIPPGFAAVATI